MASNTNADEGPGQAHGLPRRSVEEGALRAGTSRTEDGIDPTRQRYAFALTHDEAGTQTR